MSTLQNTSKVWNPLTAPEVVDSKHEKCRNITEEIYKRINITFQINKLETQNEQSNVSDNSDQIDSNELSNETDLFACDKTSISSSTENEKEEKPSARYDKFINNNNEEPKIKKPVTVYKKPRKRFRKRVKKHQSKSLPVDTDASSDDALPLCRIVGLDTTLKQDDSVECSNGSVDSVMGVPKLILVTKDLKEKLTSPDGSKSTKVSATVPKSPQAVKTEENQTAKHGDAGDLDRRDNTNAEKADIKTEGDKKASCQLCTLTFRGERGLRRHMTMSHLGNLVDHVTQKKKKDVILA